MYSSQLIRILLVILLCLTLSGCWSSTTIQNQHYVVTIGIDYEDETYIIYAQMLDFRNIAKSEGSAPPNEVNTYVGIGKGESLNMAAADLYSSSQVRIDWGQTTAFVISKRAMDIVDSQIVERFYRFPENRYNSWLYVTEEPLLEVLTTTSFYSRTVLYSILHMPNNSRSQLSSVPPIEMFKYMSVINEPDRTTMIPLIGFDTEHWKTNQSPMKLLKVVGAYIENSQHSPENILKKEELVGARWLDTTLTRTLNLVKEDDTIYAAVTFSNNKVRIKPQLVDGEVKFTIHGKYTGGMYEYIEDIEYNEMIKLIKKQIKEEILMTYKVALEKEIDIYNLTHSFRLKMPRQWKKMTDNGRKFILNEQSIQDIIIDVSIVHNGKYKRMK